MFNISFEFFPPKKEGSTAKLRDTALCLAACNPEFMSVTFGAGGSTREGTIDTVNMLRQCTSSKVVPHLSCIGFEPEEIIEILHQYKAMGVRRIIALRGDLPSGMGQSGNLRFASDLVTLIRQTLGDYFHIDVAAYPEIHPQANSAHDDVLNLKRKLDAGANGAITQYFFNPDAYFYYLDECDRQKIQAPITPGIMPITQFNKLARFSDACGAEIPRWIRKRLESYSDDIESIAAFGMEIVCHLCQRLIDGGVPGLHFYTLNKAEAVLAILDNLSIPRGHTEKKLVNVV
ncbi:MAG: methylenetetrahydrofolate reductase [NAD(P)H] [Gammaproteobacteria bacterium]|nr:methylenetetrahydrofolate reductase [NAD(P)H] [Gammaproteobacteria bacterium]MCW5583456.1 methylenetetrahydrofolate reductase [NAD(P)H] [Gammaproteobacteria bacterium]